MENNTDILQKVERSVMGNHGKRDIGASSILTVIMVAICLTGLIIVLLGGRTYCVLSGSMEPEIPTGSLVFIFPTDEKELAAGDIITFQLNDHSTATHRILSVIEKDNTLWFQTKGDANPSADGKLIHESAIVGRALFFVPMAGYCIWFFQKYFAGIVISSVCTVLDIMLLHFMLKKERKNKKGRYVHQ